METNKILHNYNSTTKKNDLASYIAIYTHLIYIYSKISEGYGISARTYQKSIINRPRKNISTVKNLVLSARTLPVTWETNTVGSIGFSLHQLVN